MKRLLITATTKDLHASAAQYALTQKGHEAIRWHISDFPLRQTVSLEVDTEKVDGALAGVEIDIPSVEELAFDVVWARRFPSPILPIDMHAGDRKVAMEQSRALTEACLPFFESIPFWVNKYRSIRYSEAKPVQLRLARCVGLNVPRTLFSNDPQAIKKFIRVEGGRVAYKLFSPAAWENPSDKSKLASTYTTIITKDDLPSDDVLRLAPGIFQTFFKKAYEVRVTCFGDHLVATKLNSQVNESTEIDWREKQNLIAMEPWSLPEDVAEKCRELMRRLDIVYGAIDFIVTLRGDYVFLEINQQGQFLWIEERTDVPVLDMVCEFLVGGEREFIWRPDHDVIRLKDFNAEAAFVRESERHGEPHNTYLVSD